TLRIARAAAAGPAAVRGLRGQAGAAVLRDACTELLERLKDTQPAYLAGLLAGAAEAVEQTRKRQQIDVVWTGPEPGHGASRLTAATVADLIGHAEREILLVTYAVSNHPAIEHALAAAAQRGVEITILAERHDDNPGYTGPGVPFPGLPALRLRWPAASRPASGAALHAKILVIDDNIALVGSANFTGRAMDGNLECGILIRGGPQPHAIREHITELQARGHLTRDIRGDARG
ncbi:MAG: DISARM system phospholipase D-like protein DrmC, partial [Streptosporangiaceae bacterium]